MTVSDGLGNLTENTYDAKGALKTVKDANNKLTTYNYDAGDRLVEVIDPLNQKTSYGYDKNGNQTWVTSPRAAVRPAGANGPETFAQCGVTGFGNSADDDGDLVTDDGCPSSFSAYDSLNRLQSSTDQLGRATVYEYDLALNLTRRTDARALVTKYFPDDLNRIDLIEHWNGTTLVDSVDYTYDEVSNHKTMADPTGTTNYGYDSLNRLTCTGPNTITGPCPSGNVGYSYDDLPGELAADYPGQRTQIAYPGGTKFAEYTYEPDGRMKTVTDRTGAAPKQTFYSYDNSGRLTRTQLPNGVYTHHKYDAADRLKCVVNDRTGSVPSSCTSATLISKFEYPVFDAVGNRKQMVDLNGTHNYQYDDLYRLTQAEYPPPNPTTDTYLYDANGNRQTKNATTYNYDAADQMTSTGGVTYGYDENGNQRTRGSDTFTYDHENRLTGVVLPNTANEPCYDLDGNGVINFGDTGLLTSQFGGTDAFYDLHGNGVINFGDIGRVTSQFGMNCPSRFTYNGDGLRVARAGSYLNWKYVWDVAAGLPVILKETDSHNDRDGHGTNNTYVYGLDLISVTDRLGGQTYFVYDGLGSTANLTNGTGTTTGTYSYDVFGAMRSESGSAAAGNEWRFTGEQHDKQTNRQFYYLRARFYDPAIGRFLSRDPAEAGHPYAYVDSNPTNLADPSGLMPSEGGAFVSCVPFVPFMDPRFFGPGWFPYQSMPSSSPLVYAGYDLHESHGTPNPSCGAGLRLRVGGRITGATTSLASRISRLTNLKGYREHLTKRDLEGAQAELAGRPTGYQHVKEVREAQQGLLRRMDRIQRLLGDTRLTPDQRAQLNQAHGEASRLLDYSERFVPRGGP